MLVSIRISDEISKTVKRMAADRKVTPSEMWRILIVRGISLQDTPHTKIMVESLCLNRRIASQFDMALLSQAKADAKTIMEVIDSQYLNPMGDAADKTGDKVGNKTGNKK